MWQAIAWILFEYRVNTTMINLFVSGRFESNFRQVIFKQILGIGGLGISCEIALRWMLLDLTDDKSALV